MEKREMKKRRKSDEFYCDPNHGYFSEHFQELVEEHGGKWVILVKGRLLAVCERGEIAMYLAQARKKYPDVTPFAAPIPREEEIECIL
jgi:hypothetical protein